MFYLTGFLFDVALTEKNFKIEFKYQKQPAAYQVEKTCQSSVLNAEHKHNEPTRNWHLSILVFENNNREKNVVELVNSKM